MRFCAYSDRLSALVRRTVENSRGNGVFSASSSNDFRDRGPALGLLIRSAGSREWTATKYFSASLQIRCLAGQHLIESPAEDRRIHFPGDLSLNDPVAVDDVRLRDAEDAQFDCGS